MTDRVESMQINLDELVSLRQQLEAAEANCQCELIKLEHQLAELEVVVKDFAVIEHSMETALAESQAREKVLRDALEQFDGLIKYQYTGNREAMSALMHAAGVGAVALDLPSDSTALDEAMRQAKREALLEAIAEWEKPYGLTDGSLFIDRLRSMAEGMK